MCSSKIKAGHAAGLAAVAQINGRPVLQPAGNRVAAIQAGRQLKKSNQKHIPSSPNSPRSISHPTPTSDCVDVNANDGSTRIAPAKTSLASPKLSPPVSPKPRPTKTVLKRANDPNGLNSSTEKPVSPKSTAKAAAAAGPALVRKKSKKSSAGGQVVPAQMDFSFLIDRAPGSIAAAQREQASLMQAQRKMRIAHYGRTASKLEGKAAPADAAAVAATASQEEKRCSFITPNSDPLYIAYHDEEWGVPVHDDMMLFQLLVLSGAQVGLDWTTILRKRNDFRVAFSDFDAEVVARFTERQIASISSECGLDMARVRGVVDNANRILEVSNEFGSLSKYLWGFVNNKPISPNYKLGRKIPVKTSKSESISKDLVRRGFRFVGPTIVHSFMQAAGLTNDHLLSCPRHHHCSSSSTTTTTTTY